MPLIDYTATGTTALKNWEIMTKASDEKLAYDDSTTFWPFHCVFMTHINNMDWTEIMTYDGVDLLDNFGQIEMDTLTDANRVLGATLAAEANNLEAQRKVLKGKAMFTYLFNSIDSKFKKFFMKQSTTHRQHGPIAWKIITEHCIKSDNQNVRRALCKTHTLTLAEYDNDVDKLITSVEENNAVLEACGQEDKAVAANLFRILKEAPCREFVDWVLSKQTSWDEGVNNFDLENFMKNAKTKYHNFVADGLWKKKKTADDVKKESEIVALTATVAELKALMAQNPNKNFKNNDDKNKSGTGWRNTPPKEGEPTTIERNGTTFNWCAHHKFWTKTHTTETCIKGKYVANRTHLGCTVIISIS